MAIRFHTIFQSDFFCLPIRAEISCDRVIRAWSHDSRELTGFGKQDCSLCSLSWFRLYGSTTHMKNTIKCNQVQYSMVIFFFLLNLQNNYCLVFWRYHPTSCCIMRHNLIWCFHQCFHQLLSVWAFWWRANKWNTYLLMLFSRVCLRLSLNKGTALLNFRKRDLKNTDDFKTALAAALAHLVQKTSTKDNSNSWTRTFPTPAIKQLLWSYRRPFMNMASSLGHRCIKASSGMAARSYENNIIAIPGENSLCCVIEGLCRHHHWELINTLSMQ